MAIARNAATVIRGWRCAGRSDSAPRRSATDLPKKNRQHLFQLLRPRRFVTCGELVMTAAHAVCVAIDIALAGAYFRRVVRYQQKTYRQRQSPEQMVQQFDGRHPQPQAGRVVAVVHVFAQVEHLNVVDRAARRGHPVR